MGIGRSGFNLVTLADGRLLAAGGYVACDDEDIDEGCQTDTSTAELYDPVANRWTPTSDVVLTTPDSGSEDGLEGLIPLSGGQVLADGDNGSAALYDPATGTWTALVWHGGWGPIALRDGSALSFGVEFFGANADVSVPFVARSDLDGGTTIVGHFEPADGAATAVLGDGRVFFAGGVVEDASGYAGTYIARAEVFDPGTGQLSELAAMPAIRGASTRTASPGSRSSCRMARASPTSTPSTPTASAWSRSGQPRPAPRGARQGSPTSNRCLPAALGDPSRGSPRTAGHGRCPVPGPVRSTARTS